MTPAPEPAPAPALASPAGTTTPKGTEAMPSKNSEILQKFYVALANAHRLSPRTVDSYRWKLGKFVARMGDDAPISTWTYADFEDFIAEANWPSLRSINKFLFQCRKFIAWCRARGLEVQAFTGEYKAHRVARGKPKAISREDLTKLLQRARSFGRKGRLEVAVGLAALAGLRRAEIAGLRWSAIDWEKRKLRVESPKTARSGDRSVRVLDIGDRLFEILQRHKGSRGENDLVLDFPSFVAKNGNRSLKALCRRCEIAPIGYHHLRHTAATLMVRGGVDLATVRDFLGHADLEMTSIYAWSDDATMKAAVNRIL